MGNTVKLVSGVILFIIGILIAYETSVYNLASSLLIVGLVISIVGVIIMISHVMDTNVDRTANMVKDFLESHEISSHISRNKEPSNFSGPLRPQRDYGGYDDAYFDDNADYYGEEYFEGDYTEPNYEYTDYPEQDYENNFDNKLDFTPYYGRPMKVTRAPKKREEEYYPEEIPEFVVEPNNNSSEIQQALLKETAPAVEPVFETPANLEPEGPARDIKIDINNPESLPVPKSLNSYVISEQGILTSQEAFDNLAVNVTKEIMLEIPSLNDLSDRFLSHVPTIYSRVIINEFDVSDMSYMFLISSLLKQGVHIKTVPKVHSINLITDDSHAMIISEDKDNMEYGAIYNDRNSISNIRASFEKTWNIASNLDESIIANAAYGGK